MSLDEVDWTEVWSIAGYDTGAGVLSMTQLVLALDVHGAVSKLDRERTASLVGDAVEAGLLADVGSIDGTKFALAGARQ